MSINNQLFGTSRTIPESGESDWGSELSLLLDDLTDGVDETCVQTTSHGVFPKMRTASATVARP